MISDVPLTSLRTLAFKGLSNLKSLYLIRLQRTFIEKSVLANFPNLETFFLENCGKHQLNFDNLFGCDICWKNCRINIVNVTIRKCNMVDAITKTTFPHLKNISNLVLNFDKIEIIGPDSFDDILPTLKTLSLRRNRLKSIPDHLFETEHALSIDLTKNPLHCDCDMEYYREFIQTTNNVNIIGIICKTPEKYHGIYLGDCPSLCEEIIKPEVHEILRLDENNEAGEKTDITCESSEPFKNIKLTKPSHKIRPVTRNKKEQLYIDTRVLLKNYKFIELSQLLPNNKKSCVSYFKGDRTPNVKFKQKMKPNTLYRFCWMRKGSTTIFPANCALFYSHMNTSTQMEPTDCDLDTWITAQNKVAMISIYVVCAILAPIFGILIAIALAKLFPRTIRGQEPKSSEKSVTTSNHRGAVNRKQYVLAFYDKIEIYF